MSNVIAITGHRPESCGPEGIVRKRLRQAIDDSGATTVIVGMAAGVDLWAGDEALQLGLEIWCARPWTTHSPRWNDRSLYDRLIDHAGKVVIVTEADTYPGPWCYQKRNEWMVDHADEVIAYWNGAKKGGTFNCITYANKVKVPVSNAYVK